MSSNSWSKVEAVVEQSGGIGFVTLADDGDSAEVIFAGEPHARQVHWNGGPPTDCGGDDCRHCGTGDDPSWRFTCNVIRVATMTVALYEFGISVARRISSLAKRYEFDDRVFTIERRGATGDIRTRYVITPTRETTLDERETVQNAELVDIQAHLAERRDEPRTSTGTGGSHLGRGTADFVRRLKRLPREAQKRWLAQLGITAVSDLRSSDYRAARALLEQLEANEGGGRG